MDKNEKLRNTTHTFKTMKNNTIILTTDKISKGKIPYWARKRSFFKCKRNNSLGKYDCKPTLIQTTQYSKSKIERIKREIGTT